MDDIRRLDVIDPAPNQDLVSLTDVRDELGAPRSQDARLKRYITAASAVIATYTRRIWREETVAETFYTSYFAHHPWGGGYYLHWSHRRFDGSAARPIVLTRYPVVSVASVTSGDEGAIDPTQYLVIEDKGTLYRWDGERIVPLSWAADTVVVTYTAGYALADIPPDVQQACMTVIRQRYYSHGRDPYLRSINVPGVQEESYWAGPDMGALPPESCGLLEKHIDMRM